MTECNNTWKEGRKEGRKEERKERQTERKKEEGWDGCVLCVRGGGGGGGGVQRE